MIMTIMVVVGALVGASAIAGSLMVRQIRQSTQGIDSTKAIFASESGIELELYHRYKDPSYPSSSVVLTDSSSTFETVVTATSIKSVGRSKFASRALRIELAPTP